MQQVPGVYFRDVNVVSALVSVTQESRVDHTKKVKITEDQLQKEKLTGINKK